MLTDRVIEIVITAAIAVAILKSNLQIINEHTALNTEINKAAMNKAVAIFGTTPAP